MAMNVEAEIRDLKRRVGELEGAFGFLSRQPRGVHRDLLAFQAKTEQKFESVHRDLLAFRTKAEQRFERLEKEVRDLRKDLPGVVANTMREVLRERDGRPRKS